MVYCLYLACWDWLLKAFAHPTLYLALPSVISKQIYMKKILYTFFALLAIAAFHSCDKQVEGATRRVTIDTALASGQVYQLNLAQYGDADDVATILKQGTGYSTSSIANTPGVFAPVYSYAANAIKSVVTDQVVLAVTEGVKATRGGRNCNKASDSTIITLNFTVK